MSHSAIFSALQPALRGCNVITSTDDRRRLRCPRPRPRHRRRFVTTTD
ncbi:hypothetical protein VZC37_19530 [Gordonia sp. LSe1-13]|uniref:Uncharacterized protein n=1 Tax=Gordonia sesuvii TaxID=3116777 RepID=A0ABU7MHF5_9ACTN|nr:hypothetical protein [Gordonia sp. LSe1-13]